MTERAKRIAKRKKCTFIKTKLEYCKWLKKRGATNTLLSKKYLKLVSPPSFTLRKARQS